VRLIAFAFGRIWVIVI